MGCYMLYAYTRIRSIARTAQVTEEQLKEARKDGLNLDHEKEVKLGKLLLRFAEVVAKMAEDLLLHSLCEFMYEVANTFTEFYENCYCVEKNKAGDIVKVNWSRILLCRLLRHPWPETSPENVTKNHFNNKEILWD